MKDKVDYEELLPHEFEARLAQHPVGYLPLGTLEWHGVQNPLGADFLQARELFRRTARRFGGIVMPPIWVGPDRIEGHDDGPNLIGMDTPEFTRPPQQLRGSLYWVPKGLFLTLVESVLAQAKRAGFKCIVADGHGPSRNAWGEMVGPWERQFGLKLVSADRDFPDKWQTQLDHAGSNETSILMAMDPSLVDLTRLLPDGREPFLGICGEDPRKSSREHGEQLLEATSAMIGEKLRELGM